MDTARRIHVTFTSGVPRCRPSAIIPFSSTISPARNEISPNKGLLSISLSLCLCLCLSRSSPTDKHYKEYKVLYKRQSGAICHWLIRGLRSRCCEGREGGGRLKDAERERYGAERRKGGEGGRGGTGDSQA